jgi:hypothetical protein
MVIIFYVFLVTNTGNYTVPVEHFSKFEHCEAYMHKNHKLFKNKLKRIETVAFKGSGCKRQ